MSTYYVWAESCTQPIQGYTSAMYFLNFFRNIFFYLYLYLGINNSPHSWPKFKIVLMKKVGWKSYYCPSFLVMWSKTWMVVVFPIQVFGHVNKNLDGSGFSHPNFLDSSRFYHPNFFENCVLTSFLFVI